MQIHDECTTRSAEIERTLVAAEAKWQTLEKRLEEAEESFLLGRLDAWKKWFGLEEEELSLWIERGLRHTVRCRTLSLLLTPIIEKMQAQVSFIPSADDEVHAAQAPTEARCGNSMLALLLNHWEKKAKPIITEAKREDDKLQKKIKKTEKDERAKGIMSLGNQDSKKVAALKRERPQLWEASQKALDRISTPVKCLGVFLDEELSANTEASLVAAVPFITSRTVCDWYFQTCLVEYGQLEEWWSNAKKTLQAKEQLWQCLLETEGILVRRIDEGIEDSGRRVSYEVHANFGGNEVEVRTLLTTPSEATPENLEKKLHLLANVVSELVRRLKAFRDGALWRIIETAQSIHKELTESGAMETLPWLGADAAEGVDLLFREVGWADKEEMAAITTESTCCSDGGEGLIDAALVSMACLERLCGICSDLNDYLSEGEVAGQSVGVCAVFQQMIALITELNEELLCLLDGPSNAVANAWLERFEQCMGNAELGQRLDTQMSALPFRRDSELPFERRRERKRWLLLARGIQVFLGDKAVRIRATSAVALLVNPALLHSAQLECYQSHGSATAEENDADAILSLSRPPSPRMVHPMAGANYTYRPPARQSITGATLDGQEVGHAAAQLVNQWQTSVPLEEFSTPINSPTAKFVDGQYVLPRPASADKRLTPLTVKPGGGGGAKKLR